MKAFRYETRASKMVAEVCTERFASSFFHAILLDIKTVAEFLDVPVVFYKWFEGVKVGTLF